MIGNLISVGQRLSGRNDPRLAYGIAWSAAEGLFAAALYPLIYLLLREVEAGAVTTHSAGLYALAMFACVMLRIAAGRIAMPMLFSAAYALMGEARLRVANHLRRLPMGWFARQRGGDLSARLTSDLELVEHLWSHFLGVFVTGLTMPICLMAFLFWIDVRMALAALAGLPLALLALWWTQRVVGQPGERLIAASASVQSELLEYVQGIAVIRSFGRFGDAWQRLLRKLDEQHAALVAVESKPTPWLVSYGFLLEAGYVGLVFAGVWWLSAGTLSALVLVSFMVLVLPVYRQLFDVGQALLMLRFSRRAMSRIEELLTEPVLPEPTSALPPQGHDIVVDAVHFAYEGAADVALRGVSCTFPARGLTAIVGPSGAGKTTLVHLIARLWDVQAGAIKIGGVDVRDIGSHLLHRHVAMVFQDVVLFSGSVRDNLRIGCPDASDDQIVAAARRACAHDFIEALPQGYDTVLDEGGASLSGGERQRLSIARALLRDAPILLLDEATASVDPSGEAEIQRALAELARGRTVIAIAHRLHSVRHAEQILVLDGGRLVERGRHEELVQKAGVYARLWERQMQARRWTLAAPGAH